MDDNWTKLLLNELKRIIKSQGFNYKELAEALEMSESGFKKLINSTDCSLSKIEKICNFVGVRMTDLFKSIEKLHLEEVSFSSDQELFFKTYRVGFLLFWFLVYERRSLEEAQNLLKIDNKKTWSYLRKMDALNLLKILPKDRISLPRPQGIKWVGSTTFIDDLYTKWGHSLLNYAIKKKGIDPENSYFSIRYLKMSESTWKDFKMNLENMEIQYTNIATREMRMGLKSLKHIRWLSIADQKSWAENELEE